VTPTPPPFFEPRKTVRDLVAELKSRNHPHFPQRRWWDALAIAESRDTMRKVRALNDSLWPDPAPILVATYLEDADPHKLIFCGLRVQMAPNNPVPEKTLIGNVTGDGPVPITVPDAEKLR
jgi:hypothetical protein